MLVLAIFTTEINTGIFTNEENTSKVLLDAMHQDELVKDDSTNIRIDYKNSGVGSNSCGSKLLEKYRLSEKEVHFEFLIK